MKNTPFKILLKFLKFIFTRRIDTVKEPEETEATAHNVYPLGADLNEHDADTREIPLAMVQTPVALPEQYETDLSAFPIFDQGSLGTCVAHAFALVKMFLDFMETRGIPAPIYSRRWLYVLTRRFSNMVNIDDMSNQGLSPRAAAKVLSTAGIITADGYETNSGSHAEYVNDYVVTDKMRSLAVVHRAGKFAFPLNDAFSLKQAVYQNKLVPITIGIDWMQIESDGTVHPPKKLIGTHEVVLCGWKIKNGETYLKFRNSWGAWWGTAGCGFIKESEVEGVVYDSVVFTDVPDSLIERAKSYQYIFLTDIKAGARGDAVKQLQKRLIEYGLLADGTADGAYGNKTMTAVKEYQKLKGVYPTGTVGEVTRASLNVETPKDKAKSRLDLWIEAGIKMEGAYPSLNNPGNIKCSSIMHKDATSMDQRGFCIFPTYEKGYMAMRNLFVRAASGASSNYHPDETIEEFYAGVPMPNRFGRKINGYAPASDKNQPSEYAAFVAKRIGVPVGTKIKDLL